MIEPSTIPETGGRTCSPSGGRAPHGLTGRSLLGLLVVLLALSLIVGVAAGAARADAPFRSPVVVYLDPTQGTFKAGKRSLGAQCWTVDVSASMDYSRCCPDAFTPVGLTSEGNLVCLFR